MQKVCEQCKQERRLTQFTLRKNAGEIDDPFAKRQDVCRFCNYDGLTAEQRHLILREAYRHYLVWGDLIAFGDGKTMHVSDVLTYNIPKEAGSDEMVSITVSYHDLARALTRLGDQKNTVGTVLSARKEQAFYLNVIRDMKQKEVADLMKITTVSVGQYVDQACLQLAEYYFGEMDKPEDQTEFLQDTRVRTKDAFGTLTSDEEQVGKE